jgi:putative ABC transport system permease protein
VTLWESCKIAVGGLLANRLRSALTMLGILIGVGAVIMLVAVGAGSSQAIQKRIESLGTNTLVVFRRGIGPGAGGRSGVGTQSRRSALTLADVKALQDKTAAPDVKEVAPTVNASVTGTFQGATYSPQQFVGTTPAYARIRDFTTAEGSFFSDDDVTAHDKVLVVGRTVVTNLFGSTDPVGQQVKLNSATFTVVGVLEPKGSNGAQDQDDVAMAPYTAVQDSLTGNTGSLGSITVEAASRKQMDAAAAEVTAVLSSTHKLTSPANPDFNVLNQATLLSTSTSTSRTFTVLLGAVAAISLLVGGIGVMNIMLVTVTERTREIGIRKAIGARRTHILSQFLVEAVLLSILGGVLGVVAGIIGSQFKVVGVTPVVQPYSAFLAFGVAVAVGLFFGIYPANRAASLRPIEALRYE